VESFASGKASMTDIHLSEDNPIINKSIIDVVKKYNSKVIMASVKRGDNVFIPGGDFTFNVDDILSIIGKDTDIADFCKKIKIFKAPAKSVSIIGGGKIGFYLAEELLSAGLDVKIIEKDDKRCEVLSNELEGVTVLHGDGGDKSLLIEENLSKTDALVSLTGADEENAIVSLYAKEMNVNKIITKVERPSIKKMLDTLGLDTVVVPQEVIANHMVRFVRASSAAVGDKINTLYKLSDDVEALEFTVHDDFETGVPIKDLKIKKGILIGGIVRRGEYVLPTGNTAFEIGDRVIVVASARTITSLKEILR
jgi:trk system potassium uptake protein TrkA